MDISVIYPEHVKKHLLSYTRNKHVQERPDMCLAPQTAQYHMFFLTFLPTSVGELKVHWKSNTKVNASGMFVPYWDSN